MRVQAKRRKRDLVLYLLNFNYFILFFPRAQVNNNNKNLNLFCYVSDREMNCFLELSKRIYTGLTI